MRWLLTIELYPEEGHGHVDVADPSEAALALNQINDERTTAGERPAGAYIRPYTGDIVCSCGERFTERPAAGAT